jgi:hypothetical protein
MGLHNLGLIFKIGKKKKLKTLGLHFSTFVSRLAPPQAIGLFPFKSNESIMKNNI